MATFSRTTRKRVASVRSRRGRRRPPAPAGTGTATNAVYHLDKADVVVSLDADFLGFGAGDGPLHEGFRRSPPRHRRAKRMNRLYVVESSPTLTGGKADHRLPLRASDIEGFAREPRSRGRRARRTGRCRCRPERSRSGSRPSARTCRRIAAARSSIAGDYQPAAVHALAHAMNQALGNVGTTVTYGASIEPQPIGQHASLAELATAMDAGQVELLRHPRQQPGLHGAGGPEVRASGSTRSALVVYHSLYHDETASSPLEHPRGALARDLGRCARLRRHRHADPAAHRAALRRALGARSPRDAHERSRAARRSTSSRTTGRARSAARRGWTVRNADGETFANADAFWKQALHDGFIRGTATTGGGQATPFKPAPAAAVAAPAAAAGAAAVTAAPAPAASGAPVPAPAPVPPAPRPLQRRPGAAAGLEIVFRPDPDSLGRPLRQQRLAAGAAEAADEADVGHGGLDQPDARRGAACSINGDVIELRYRGADRAHAGLRRARAARRVGHGVPRLRPAHGRPRRHRERGGAGVQRLPAAHVRRALVRHRARDREDRRALSARHDAGPPRDGRPRTRRASSTLEEYTARTGHRRAHGSTTSEDADAVSRTTNTRATSGAWRST